MVREYEVVAAKRLHFMLGLAGLAVMLAAVGVALIVGGARAGDDVKSALVAEKVQVADPAILLTYHDTRAPQGLKVPNVLVDTADEARLQATVIKTHALTSSKGQTWTEIPRQIADPNNPGMMIDNPVRTT